MHGCPRVAETALGILPRDPCGSGGAALGADVAVGRPQSDTPAHLDEERVQCRQFQRLPFGPRVLPDQRPACDPRPTVQYAGDIARPPCGGIDLSGCPTRRGKAQQHTRGRAPIHPCHAVVPGAAEPLHRLQADQRKDPVLRRGLPGNLALHIMVARGDQHVERIGCCHLGPLKPARIGRLQKGRARAVGANQVPGLVIGEAGSEGAQGGAPAFLVLRQVAVPGGVQRQNRKLHQKHVPGRTLMRAQRGKALYLAPRHGGQEARQAVPARIGLDQPLAQQVKRHLPLRIAVPRDRNAAPCQKWSS